MKILWTVVLAILWSGNLLGAGQLPADSERRRRARQLVDLFQNLQQPAVQPPGSDPEGQRQEPGAEVGFPGQVPRELRGDPPGGGRDHVSDPPPQCGGRPGCQDRARLLDLPPQDPQGSERVLRPCQPGVGHPGRPSLPGHAGCPPAGDRRQDRLPGLGREAGGVPGRLCGHHGPRSRSRTR